MTDKNIITGKAQVVQDMYDFKYYIEQQWSDGSWRRNHAWPSFGTIDDAHAHFQRAKKVRKNIPAVLGDINDA